MIGTMKTSKHIFKITAIFFAVIMFLTGCGGSVTVRGEGDCPVYMVYTNGSSLARAPHFFDDGVVVTKEFNGTEWYKARIITAEEGEELISEFELISESTNMKLLKISDESEWSHIFLMEAGDYFVRFDVAEEYPGYSTDFNIGIKYYNDDEEIIPDLSELPKRPGSMFD